MPFTMPLSDALLALVGGSIAALIAVLSSLLAWLSLKYFNLKGEVDSLDQRVRGDDRDMTDSGYIGQTQKSFNDVFDRLDQICDQVQDLEDCHQHQYNSLVRRTDKIIRVLHDHDLNGDLPNDED